jgi:hypothetical protein
LEELRFLPGDLKFEANLERLPTTLLPVAANAVELLAIEGELVAKPGGDAGTAFELCHCLHEQLVAGSDLVCWRIGDGGERGVRGQCTLTSALSRWESEYEGDACSQSG